MADKSRHRARAEQNEAFYIRLASLSERAYDWEVTAMFYAALHWIEAYLASCGYPIGRQLPDSSGGHHPRGHAQRRQKVATEPVLAQIDAHFRELHSRSEQARYDLVDFTPTFVTSLFEYEYQPIRDLIRPRL
jgi:hypothetical protein